MKYSVFKKFLILVVVSFMGAIVNPVMDVSLSQGVSKEIEESIIEDDVKEDPEIDDKPGDTFGYLDILSAWFYEKPDEPDYLYIAMKIRELKISLRTVFSVYWMYNEVRYVSTMFVGSYGTYWSVGYFDRGWQTTRSNGSYDLQSGAITMKIQKSKIGNPQPGDELTDTYALAWQKIIFGWIPWFVDHAPDKGYGENYIIQY